MKFIILAGGGGTRLWPLSTKKKPKQFCKLLGDKTLLKSTFERLRVFGTKNIYLSCSKSTLRLVRKELPQLPASHIIIEPEKRDTAAAMGLAAAYLAVKYPNEPLAFIPSDHYILNENKFRKSLKVAEGLIKKTGKMLDIGIEPNFPSTVLGYTCLGKMYKNINGVTVYNFKKHTEKPKLKTAQKYLKAKNYLWHANYYMWTPNLFLESFKKYSPGTYRHLIKIKNNFEKNKSIVQEFKKIKKISFDYAITEKINPRDALIIKGDFGWYDLGAWDVLCDAQKNKLDKNKNLVKGKFLGLDTKDSLIYNYEDKPIATIGVKDLVIVNTKDGLLICPKSLSSLVREVSKKLDK